MEITCLADILNMILLKSSIATTFELAKRFKHKKNNQVAWIFTENDARSILDISCFKEILKILIFYVHFWTTRRVFCLKSAHMIE